MADVVQEATSGLCSICLEREAVVVAISCGHLVCCVACRRRLVHEVRVSTGKSSDTSTTRRNLSTKQLERTILACPICRTESALRHQERFDGQLFIPAENPDNSDNDVKIASAEVGPDDNQELALVQSGGASSSKSVVLEESSCNLYATADDCKGALMPVRSPTAAEKQKAQVKKQLEKLWKQGTTSLMNDHGMDSFLGGAIYRSMQNDTFQREIFLGGKTGKYANKRRKSKIRVVSGVRLDGGAVNGGSVATTVAQVEEMEQTFGKLVSHMLTQLAACRKGSLDVEMETLANATESVLIKYQARHERRTSDLEHIIQHGALPPDYARDIDKLRICLPQCGKQTTFLLDGAQIYILDELTSTNSGNGKVLLMPGNERDAERTVSAAASQYELNHAQIFGG